VGKWQLGVEKDSPRHFGFDESCLWQHYRKKNRDSGNGKRVDSRYVNPRLEINGEEKDFDNGEFGPDVVSDYACEFMRKNKDKPFLVYYPMILTHCPFVPTPGTEAYNPESPGSPSYSGSGKYFGDMVAHTDKIVQKIWDTVRDIGQEDNTLIIFTCDNGTEGLKSMMGDRQVKGGKGKMTDAGTHVPLIAYWKGTTAKGLVTDTLVDFSDLLPTICDATGTDVLEPVDGQSFLPQLRGEEGAPREFAHVWYMDKKRNVAQFTRNQTYKLYKTGEFYNVEKDHLETQSITNPNDEEKKVRAMLQKGLEKYSDLRFSHLKHLRKK
jgi:arylsulfatase A